MQNAMTSFDVAIIGGGAAGIAAARLLAARKRSVLLIDALPRLGGRARTEVINGIPLDFGCEWLHSAERNPLAKLAEDMGFAVDHSKSAWERSTPNLLYGTDERHEAGLAYDRFVERLHADPPPSDRASDRLDKNDRWRPFVDALSSFINGTETDDLSVADFVAYDNASTHSNWRLIGGYGAFIASLGADLSVALSTIVTSISHDNDIEIETSHGKIRASAAIVTVSTAVLAAGAIRFTPAIDDHSHAASCLPLGLADKVFLSIAEPESIIPETHMLGRLDRSATAGHYFRAFGRPAIECYVGGTWARSLEKAGEAEAVSFAIGELRDLLGSDFARGLSPLAVTRWGQEPSIRGSYSHALPGHAAARAVLARPVSERLCLAGEACSPENFSTAHGAWQSGLSAADWIERHLS